MEKRIRVTSTPTWFIAAAGLCCLGVTARAATLNVGSATGAPGAQVTVSVSLSSDGATVAGTQNDIAFTADTPVAATTTGGNCAVTTTTSCTSDNDCPDLQPPLGPGKEPCLNLSTVPDCDVNPAINKGGIFAFEPSGCAGAACTSIRALIFSFDDVTGIADGPVYSCKVNIASTATEGDKTLTNSDVVLSAPDGTEIAGASGSNGTVTVGGPQPQHVLVCDVTGPNDTGTDFGQFGDGNIRNNDVVAIFKASLLTPPPAGSALFSAMDSAPADAPPVCGGDTHIRNNDVVACFKLSLLGGAKTTRSYSGGTGGTCTSTQQ